MKERSRPGPTPARLAGVLLDWFATNARDLPWRHTRDPYAIWISEVMLQQTQVQTVIPYWTRWMSALPTLASLAAAPITQVLKLWEGLGYYHRARNLQRAARQVVVEHDGAFPRQPEQVLALPGIGSYTAGAIGSLAYNDATPVLDGNVVRVLARLFGIRQRVDRVPTRRRLEALARALVEAAARQPPHEPSPRSRRREEADSHRPASSRRRLRGEEADRGESASSCRRLRFMAVEPDWRVRRVRERPCGALNEALMELGAVVCTPRAPRCERCPLSRHCLARKAGCADRLPVKPRRPRTLVRRVLVFVCRRNRRWLVRQRPFGVVNAGLWELPNLEAAAHTSPLEAARALFGPFVRATVPLLSLQHSITRHRITLEVHEVVTAGEVGSPAAARWQTARQLERLAFPAAHRKILRHLLEATPRLAKTPRTGSLRA